MRYPKPEVDREAAMKLWIEEHSDYAKEQAILNNIGIIRIVLKSLHISLDDEDFLQIGVTGLVGALNSFDPSKGFTFSSYAATFVRNEILKTLRTPKKRMAVTLSLEKELGEDDFTLEDTISSGERFEDLSVLKVDLENAMGRLKEREKLILRLLISGETQASIAKMMGMSRENVRRILKDIKRKINY